MKKKKGTSGSGKSLRQLSISVETKKEDEGAPNRIPGR